MSFLLGLLLSVAPAFAGGPSIGALDDFPERPTVPAIPEGWVAEDGMYLRVFSSPQDQSTASRLASHGNQRLPELAHRLGLSIGTGTVEVYLAPTQDEFNLIQPGTPPDWADGTAWPQDGLVFLRSPRIRPGTAEPLEQVLDHELIHILVGRAFGDRVAPRWLQEGLATWYSGEMTVDRTRLILEQNHPLPLNALSDAFHADALTARLAYAQSADFVAFLAHSHGEEVLGKLIDALAAGHPVPIALRQVTGENPVQLEARWLARLADPWVRIPYQFEAVAWGVGLVGAAFAWKRRSERNARKIAQWEEEERREEERMRARMRVRMRNSYYRLAS